MGLIRIFNGYFQIAVLGAGLCLLTSGSLCAEAQKSDGGHKAYYDTGQKQYDSNYKNGKLDGLTTEYEKDGTVKDRFYFKKDVLISKQGKETVRDMGPIEFLFHPWFWIIVFGLGIGGWFFFSRVLMKGK